MRDRVSAALTSGRASWCPPVQLELWNGARGEKERKVLREFAGSLPSLDVDDQVWAVAYDMARRARARGVTVPAADILIAACARSHGAFIETSDGDFALLAAIDE